MDKQATRFAVEAVEVEFGWQAQVADVDGQTLLTAPGPYPSEKAAAAAGERIAAALTLADSTRAVLEAEEYADGHLDAIRWVPEQGMDDKGLGLGEEACGGPWAWQSGREWTALYEDAVRRLAAEMVQRFSEAEETYRERGASEARAAIEKGATAPWGETVELGE